VRRNASTGMFLFVVQTGSDLTGNWPFFFDLRPGPAKLARVFIDGQIHVWPDCRGQPFFWRWVTPISLAGFAILRWRQKVTWKVYSFAFSYFILYLQVSDVTSCNIRKLVKFTAVITN